MPGGSVFPGATTLLLAPLTALTAWRDPACPARVCDATPLRDCHAGTRRFGGSVGVRLKRWETHQAAHVGETVRPPLSGDMGNRPIYPARGEKGGLPMWYRAVRLLLIGGGGAMLC